MRTLKLSRMGLVAAVTLALALTGCNSAGGADTGNNSVPSGINGTGYSKGAVQRFGSIYVNGREFDTTGSQFLVDGQNGTQSDLIVGNVVEVEAKFHADGSATATKVIFEADLEGPVADVNRAASRFTVAGQTVKVNATTIFEKVTLAELAQGDWVEVSGSIDSTGVLVASSVEKETPPTTGIVEVKGTVSSLNIVQRSFKINNLTVNYAMAQLDPNTLALQDGLFVEVTGTVAGNLMTATEVEQEDRKPDAQEGDVLELEGIVDTVNGQQFKLLNGQTVAYDANTTFEDGTSAGINAGAEVEVSGKVDAAGVLQAHNIELDDAAADPKIEIAAKVDATDANSNTVTVFGSIVVQTSDDTRIRDELGVNPSSFGVGDLVMGDYVEIAAYKDAGGNLVAVKLEREADDGEVALQAALDSKEAATSRITILGVTVDVSGASFEDKNENAINKTDFFNAVQSGDLVEVSGAWNSNRIQATVVALSDD